QTSSSGSTDAMKSAIEHVRKSGVPARRIGAELGFLPVDAGDVLRAAYPDVKDALFVLERLRARKTSEELRKLRTASDRVIESMMTVIAKHGPGTTKRELVEALRREEVN